MSWKSIVITGLLCVLASPVLAQPGLVVDLVRTGGGNPLLDGDGNWQWQVSVDPDETLFSTTDEGTGGSMAIEIGLDFTGASIVSAAVNATNFDQNNFGQSPFAFGENPDDGMTIQGDQLFAALGSTFFTDGALKEVLTVKTTGPSTVGPALNTSVSWLGDYSGNVRVAQDGTNYDTFVGSASYTALAGDANLDGTANDSDLSLILSNFNGTGNWSQGNFNGPGGNVDDGDLSILLSNFNATLGAGAVSGSAVPEPGTAVLLVLSSGALILSRKRG